jgi:hypothetical protein
MTDLTKITTPYGFLDEATQKALRECGGPYQIVCGWGWDDADNPAWVGGSTYRLKPQPPKPREFWLVTTNPDEAWLVMHSKPKAAMWTEIIHVREVLEP